MVLSSLASSKLYIAALFFGMDGIDSGKTNLSSRRAIALSSKSTSCFAFLFFFNFLTRAYFCSFLDFGLTAYFFSYFFFFKFESSDILTSSSSSSLSSSIDSLSSLFESNISTFLSCLSFYSINIFSFSY